MLRHALHENKPVRALCEHGVAQTARGQIPAASGIAHAPEGREGLILRHAERARNGSCQLHGIARWQTIRSAEQ